MDESDVIKEQFEKSAPEIKKLLAENTWTEIVSQISDQYSLGPEQTTALENELLFVLLNMEPTADLAKNIQNSLQISPELGGKIFQEAYERLIKRMEQFLPAEIEGEEEPPLNVPAPPSEEVTLKNIPEVKEEKEIIAPNMTVLHDPIVEAAQAPEPPKEEEEKLLPQPKSSYSGGQDPYREPLN